MILPDYTVVPGVGKRQDSSWSQSEEILVTSKLRLSSLQVAGGTLSFSSIASLIQWSELRHSDRQTDSFTRVPAWKI